MAKRRVSISEYNRLVRQHNQKLKREIDKFNREEKRRVDNYNREVKKVNAHNKKVVDNYNREVRKYNASQRQRKQNLQRALNQLNSTSRTTTTIYSTTEIYESSRNLNQSYDFLQTSYNNSQPLIENQDLYTFYPEQETTNSIELCNALNGYYTQDISSDFLMQSEIEVSLSRISSDLGDRWKGALFSLNHNNPDASRHFCSSVREILTEVINIKAPDSDVLLKFPNCELHQNKPNRRTKIKYILYSNSITFTPFEDFLNDDIDDILKLFYTLNSGTHGKAGKLNSQQLIQLKKRVEDSIKFVLNFE